MPPKQISLSKRRPLAIDILNQPINNNMEEIKDPVSEPDIMVLETSVDRVLKDIRSLQVNMEQVLCNVMAMDPGYRWHILDLERAVQLDRDMIHYKAYLASIHSCFAQLIQINDGTLSQDNEYYPTTSLFNAPQLDDELP